MIETRFLDVTATGAERPARLAVHIAGRGPLAVLLHGFPLDSRMWLDVLHGPLAQQRTLCAIDLRGHGQSPWCGDHVHSMERFADDVAAVIKTLAPSGETDGQADVAGLSMGGYVAFALHARHPELVRSLVLSNTRAAADTEAQGKARESGIETVVEHGRTAVYEGMIHKLLTPGADLLRHAQLRSMIEAVPTESVVADQRGLQARLDRLGELAEIRVPTLVIAGDHDTITPVAEAKVMADGIANAHLKVIEGTAHMTPLEDAYAWSQAAGAFWQQ